jgi:hypothetical protein
MTFDNVIYPYIPTIAILSVVIVFLTWLFLKLWPTEDEL